MPFFLLEPFAALEKSGEPNWPTRILGVLIIAVVTLFVWALVRRAARRARLRFEALHDQLDEGDPRASIAAAQRLTALHLVVNSARYVLFGAAILLIFSQLNLLKSDSLLFPAGFLGAALGLGAQNLVRDVVAGLFIVFEGQFAVGDYVKVNGVAGRVSEVGLRVTSLRDELGQIHFFPNGAITTVARASRSAAEFWLWVPVSAPADRSQVISVTRSTLDDFDAIFNAWQEEPALPESSSEGNRLRFVLHAVPSQTSFVREKLPARVAGALEAAGLKSETGATVELTAAPTA